MSLGVIMSFSQNLEKIGKRDMLKVNGGLNFNSIFLNTNNPASTRAPFSWYLSGNIGISILDWSIPFTYAVSNQSRTFSQPFNQYGITPTYKWIKIYAGWSNMSFSQFTMSGYPFLGGGLELSPKNWKMILFYGRFKKAVEYDALNESDSQMAFKRMGMGAKIGYEKKGYGLNLIFFKAADDPHSLKFVPDNTNITPRENVVVSAIAKAPITSFFTFETEYAISGLTRNTLSEERTSGSANYKLPFFKERISSQFFSAFKSSLTFNSKYVSLAANYERIDPDYGTLGAYYFNNDLQNVTLAPQLRLFKNKLTLALNGGMQQNNLDKAKLSTSHRMVLSGNISLQPNAHWMMNALYSNFTSYSRNRPNTDPFYTITPADTMRFYQVSRNAGGTCNYNTTKGNIRYNTMLSLNHQVSTQQTNNSSSPGVVVYNANLAYTITHQKMKLNISLTGNANRTEIADMNTLLYGPGLTVGKSFMKNTLHLSLGSIYNASFNNNISTGAVYSERLSLSFNPKVKDPKFGRPSLSLSCSYINKPKIATATFALSEFTGNVNVSHSF